MSKTAPASLDKTNASLVLHALIRDAVDLGRFLELKALGMTDADADIEESRVFINEALKLLNMPPLPAND